MATPKPPPSRWEIDSTLEAFLGGQDPQEVKVTPWPTRPERTVGLRPLLAAELNECDRIARKWANDSGIPYSLDIRSDCEMSHVYLSEIVARALVHPETNDPLCTGGGAELRAKVRPETIRDLGHQLADWTKHTAPPVPPTGTKEEFDRILAVLGEEQGATLLEACEPATLRGLLLYTVAQHRKSTGSTSTTTTPESIPGDDSPG